jgi:glycosyltransferase involved in cell wall biosynthesis
VRYAAPADETFAYTGTMSESLRSPRGLRALASMISSLRREATAALVGSPRAVVHAHWWVPAGIATPSDVRSVITCHGTDVRLLAKGGPFQWIGRRVLRRARVVTTVSRPFAEAITERTGVTIADDAIQPMPVATTQRPPSTGGGGLVVIGRLTAQKRVDLALRAYAALRARVVALPLTVVGDGAAFAELVALAASLGVGEHVRFTGAMAPAAVPGVLATADCCVMTAQEEGLGLVAAEALMQGVPVVVCTDGGGVLDVVPASGGGRVVPPDAFAIAGAVESILADDGAKQAAAELGRAWAQRLSPGFVAERAIGWYERALA